MYGRDLFPLIHADSKTDRFSENLMKWVRKHRTSPIFVAYSRVSIIDGKPLPDFSYSKTCAGNLYVGFGDIDDGWLHGSRLSEIICNGVRAKEWANPPKYDFHVISDWWERYITGGKCCIDPEHKLYHDRERWELYAGGRKRKCVWCGNFEQYQHTEMVPKSEWRDMA